MIAALCVVDQAGDKLFPLRETNTNHGKHEKRVNRPDELCCQRTNIRLRDGFRFQRLRQYPFCRSEMYVGAHRRIYLRPTAVQVETYC